GGGGGGGGGGGRGGEQGLGRRDRHEGAGGGGRRRRLDNDRVDHRRGPGLLGSAARAPLALLSFHAPHHTGQTRDRLGSARCRPSRGWGPAGRGAPLDPRRRGHGQRPRSATATNRVGRASSGRVAARD